MSGGGISISRCLMMRALQCRRLRHCSSSGWRRFSSSWLGGYNSGGEAPSSSNNKKNQPAYSRYCSFSSSSLTSSGRRATSFLKTTIINSNLGGGNNRMMVVPGSQLSSYPRRSFLSTNSSSNYPPHTIFPMPALSPTMDVGTIANYNLKEGDEFAAGDVLCSIETDKATLDFEATDDGIVAKWLVGTNTEIPVGTPICVVVEDAADVSFFQDYKVESGEKAATTAAAADDTAAAPPAPVSSQQTTTSDSPSLLLPSARHLAESQGKDATVLVGSGKGGRVTKADVMTAMKTGTLPDLVRAAPHEAAAPPQQAPAPVAETVMNNVPLPTVTTTASEYEDVPNNKMRKIIASRLTESKRDVPHSYASTEVALDEVMKLRKRLANEFEIKVSVNDCILRCCALALRDVPAVNAQWTKQETVEVQNSVDISVAVATPTGLITPIVTNADQRGLSSIASTVRDLATRARDGQLAPHEYQGGSFSVSNLGMFGINEFSAVINPPQAAILAVGGGSPKIVNPAYDESLEEQPKPYIETVLTARLSADRRVVDEATAAQFLQVFRYYMETPELLVL